MLCDIFHAALTIASSFCKSISEKALTARAWLIHSCPFMTHSLREVSLKPLLSFFLIFGLALIGYVPLLTPATAEASSVNVWWPTDGASVDKTQPFKAMVPGLDVASYEMYWRVDNGQWNPMSDNATDYPHKEAAVDLSGWTWHGSGPYTIDFSARQNGAEIARVSTHIYVGNGLPQDGSVTASAPAPVAQPAASVAAPVTTQANQIIGEAQTAVANIASSIQATGLYVDPNSDAATQAAAWSSSDPTGAAEMHVLAAAPTAVWFGDWNGNIATDVATLVNSARAAGKTPELVTYDIPERDCGGYSSGGTNNPAGYKSWIDAFASGLGTGSTIVILEPDALAQMDCLSQTDQNTRLSLLSYAIGVLKTHPGTKVYLDAGHAGWIGSTDMADRLARANVAAADGFSLNVSNYMPTAGEVAYGDDVGGRLGGKHFVVDTSRSGAAVSGWCNPSGAAIGQAPTTATGDAHADAFLWLKVPGESDGTCNGGPSAGTWWPAEALSLVANAK